MRALADGRGRAFTDIETSRLWLGECPQATDATGIIGFCMGCGFALVTCDKERYDVASVNYARVPDDLGRSCPVVGSYGGRDRQLPGAAGELRGRLAAAGVEHDVRDYPDSGHAFLNDEVPGPRALAPLMHVAGLGGPQADREDAWRRIEDFFAAHLG